MMKNKKIVIQTVLCIMSVVLIWSGYIFTLRYKAVSGPCIFANSF